MPETVSNLDALHRAGWSIGDTAFHGSAGVAWVVYGTNGENAISSG
jgi:hypothetical protein